MCFEIEHHTVIVLKKERQQTISVKGRIASLLKQCIKLIRFTFRINNACNNISQLFRNLLVLLRHNKTSRLILQKQVDLINQPNPFRSMQLYVVIENLFYRHLGTQQLQTVKPEIRAVNVLFLTQNVVDKLKLLQHLLLTHETVNIILQENLYVSKSEVQRNTVSRR